jgi:hypothetical protein
MSLFADAIGAVAVVLGCWLAALFLRDARPPGLLRLAHGVAGTAALATALSVVAAQNWEATAFQWDAVGLLAIALGLGLAMLLAWGRLGNARGMVVVMHGFAGMAGAALLASLIL